jgi:hypothetical protein
MHVWRRRAQSKVAADMKISKSSSTSEPLIDLHEDTAKSNNSQQHALSPSILDTLTKGNQLSRC